MRNSEKSWYSIEAKAGKKEADVFIYDVVGIWGVSANEFVRELNNLDVKTINLRINSPGGNVFDGVAIFNALIKHDAYVKTHIEALAASISSIIALAGDEVEIAENAFYMIHNPYTWAMGDAESMRKTARMLDKVTDSLIKTYTNKTGKSAEEVKQLMDDETWFTSDEAKAAGFADSITDEEEVEAAFDLSVFNNVPEHVYNSLKASKPSPRKLEHVLREAGGLSKTEATAVINKGYQALGHREDDGSSVQREVDSKPSKIKSEEKDMTGKDFKAQHPKAYAALVTDVTAGLMNADDVEAKVNEGIKAETERILDLDKLSAAMPGNEPMIEGFKKDRAITAEKAALQVIAAHGERLNGIKAAQDEDAAELNKVPGSNTGAGDGGAVKKDFTALVAEYQAEHKCTISKAIKATVKENPKVHAAYIASQNKEVSDV